MPMDDVAPPDPEPMGLRSELELSAPLKPVVPSVEEARARGLRACWL